jgi:probable rRNA maturation factor
MTLEIDIERVSPLWAGLPGLEALVERVLRAAARGSAVALSDGAEVSVRLVDDNDIRALNARWRGLDGPTNVLSFPAAQPGSLAGSLLLGDIVVAYETAKREALDEGVALSDHVAHLIAHGFLHLLGFDHRDAEEAERMEGLEIRILAEVGVANPYVGTVAADES